MSDNIVNLQGRTTLTPVKTSNYRCSHAQITLCEHKRTLECEGCGKVIEPFDYLWGFATGQQRIKWRIDGAKSEAERLESQVAELKKEKRNLQAQVARQKKKIT